MALRGGAHGSPVNPPRSLVGTQPAAPASHPGSEVVVVAPLSATAAAVESVDGWWFCTLGPRGAPCARQASIPEAVGGKRRKCSAASICVSGPLAACTANCRASELRARATQKRSTRARHRPSASMAFQERRSTKAARTQPGSRTWDGRRQPIGDALGSADCSPIAESRRVRRRARLSASMLVSAASAASASCFRACRRPLRQNESQWAATFGVAVSGETPGPIPPYVPLGAIAHSEGTIGGGIRPVALNAASALAASAATVLIRFACARQRSGAGADVRSEQGTQTTLRKPCKCPYLDLFVLPEARAVRVPRGDHSRCV